MASNRSFKARVAGCSRIGQPRAWLQSAAIVAVLAAQLPFLKAVLEAFRTNPYAGHVIFVPVLAAVLFWVDRRRLPKTTAPGAMGACLTGLALVMSMIAYQRENVPFQALSFIGALAGLGCWFYGVRILRRGGFVLAFLLLMIPPPRDVVAAIAPSVQHWVAIFSRVVLDCLQIPVEQRGVVLRLPDLALEVAEECAGLRFLPMLFVFVSAFARLVLPTASTQMTLIFLSIPVAVLANATRVAATGVGVYVIGPHVATGPLHYYIGKSFWACALLTMIAFAWLLRSRAAGAVARGRTRADACVAGTP
jgi:exosortase